MVSVASGEAIDPSPSNDAREAEDDGSSESGASAAARRRGGRKRPRGPVRCSARLSTAPAAGPAAAGGEERARRALQAAAKAEAARRRQRALERAREVEDSPCVLRDKCRRLARALRNAKHLVVYTGAGISTAADIPDYRGPSGVWTRLQRGEAVGRVEVSRATPTFTHMALTALWARGTLKFVVSQNCDGLHLRAGLPRRALAELHGDMFAERCPACRRVYLRAFDTTERTARHAHGTRRLCHACGVELRDSIVHFGERGRAAWPLNWAGALRHAAAADVVLCLGSSLKVLRRYPRLWRMQRAPHARPALYIVNLQWTPKDAGAALKINARCDEVMAQLARRLRLRVPRYSPRGDPLLAHAVPLAPAEAHTTRRPLLGAPPGAPSPPPASPPSSPSASDSDEELPLRRLAERLRGPPPELLHAFQVNLRSGDATILLRAQHAPSAGAAPARAISELRRFRIARRPPDVRARGDSPPAARPNGHARLFPPSPEDVKLERDEIAKLEWPTEREWIAKSEWTAKQEVTGKSEWTGKPDRPAKAEWTAKLEWTPKSERSGEIESVEAEAKSERSSPEGSESSLSDSEALAAAIIARAVLLCRASLYPGLHTILAPAAPPAAECAWCARRFAARRCLWYGPPPAERAARPRRAPCACCGPGASPPPPAQPVDEGGWYGKGYRKGRRRRR